MTNGEPTSFSESLHHGEIENILVIDHKLLIGSYAKTFFLHLVDGKTLGFQMHLLESIVGMLMGEFSNTEKNAERAYEYKLCALKNKQLDTVPGQQMTQKGND
ncbi:hypothetical protein HPG69_011582 [Diceros bicornis minor]|uniref:Uncharacterized protein n=1 Tax=Diceros bicornis minor TaxID=77932 RepID=A0A7J7EH25_DICBM|nr:hypothetical protein HPG69_011582 [Diceros bicornis minor]